VLGAGRSMRTGQAVLACPFWWLPAGIPVHLPSLTAGLPSHLQEVLNVAERVKNQVRPGEVPGRWVRIVQGARLVALKGKGLRCCHGLLLPWPLVLAGTVAAAPA
jgi:hypothetical protein